MITVSNRNFYIDQVSDVTVVCFTVTKIVERNYEDVADELFELIQYLTSSGPVRVALDLFSVRMIDDWAMAMLRAFHETIESHQGMVVLCRIPQAVSTALADAGMRDSFHIRDTRREAIGSFEG